MTISWGQYYNGYNIEQIDKATSNVLKITNKIIELNKKLENCKEEESSKRISIIDNIERLEMSKTCIIYYYGLDIQ